jgi:anaerobic selenocysteine-containing dehydrogenase
MLADSYATAGKTIIAWCLGLTQHEHGVATIREIVNVLLMRGSIGREGAGPCPIRGHSNVQGNRRLSSRPGRSAAPGWTVLSRGACPSQACSEGSALRMA